MVFSSTIDRPLRATLYELGLCSDDPGRLAEFYNKAMGYRFSDQDGGLIGTARNRRLGIVLGPSKTLAYAGYAVPDQAELAALERRLATAGVASERVVRDGFAGAALSFCDPDGNHFLFGVAAPEPLTSADPISERAARVQHVVFSSTDVEQLLAFMIEVVGFTLSDRVVDKHGALRTAFVRCSHEHHSLAVFAANENRLDHHCYEAEEWNLIRDWADHFARQRIPLKWGPGRHGPGDNLFMFIHDPDDNWVEISAELEQVQPDRPVGEWPHEEYTLNSWGTAFLRS